MNLLPIGSAEVAKLLAGEVGDLDLAPGWPHEDTEPGLSFVATGGRSWLIVDDDGRVAGECGTKTAPDADGTVEIGYGLAPQSRGRGLGSRALQLLIDELAATPGVRRIDAQVHVANTPSIRLLERAGFAAQGRRGPEWSYSLDLSSR